MITCSMTNEDGITLLEGQTSGLVPGVKEREVLVRMLAEAIRPTWQPMGRRARGMTSLE
ncbi:Acyl dehydratase [Pseudomonas chlororaphis subsp. aurantiaca]|nr:Acyl dehydratase [Pseudomonas chlororaphis subsp. aurantiaca]